MDSSLPKKAKSRNLLRIPAWAAQERSGKSKAVLYALSEQIDNETRAKLRTYLAEKERKRSAAFDHEARAVKKQREVKAIDKHFGAL